jgi:aspartyl-tRNA(Asn)/glutamyl-tRNA(Gln) amidotransferase subunit B
MKYLTTIGLEVHVQLKTVSKMFCGCSTAFAQAPNTNVCPVCLGYPGAMPVMNEEAIRLTVRSGLMLGCQINGYSKFDRKSYFYPDMPKNYQISQFDQPLCLGGGVDVDTGEYKKRIGLTRIHLEEDVGKSMHFAQTSGVDFNRAGHPLMEIVSEPDMSTPEEAQAFLQELRRILLYAGVSDCNLEEGNMRCDVNVSVRPEGQATLGTKAELKNLNTFKGVLNALRYEETRQVELLESGGHVIQETRRWDPDMGVTSSMRTKEDAHDYRYFPEPDLMPVCLDEAQIEAWRATLPELPADRAARFEHDLGLPAYDAGVLVADRAVADYFEVAVRAGAAAKSASNWIMTDVLRVLSEQGMTIASFPVSAEDLAGLIDLLESKTLNAPSAKQVFEKMVAEGGTPKEWVAKLGLEQVSDSSELEGFVKQAMDANPKSVEDYRNGKKAAAQFLMGQVMKLSRGKANPGMVMKMLTEQLGG